jgi:hypothetical protein
MTPASYEELSARVRAFERGWLVHAPGKVIYFNEHGKPMSEHSTLPNFTPGYLTSVTDLVTWTDPWGTTRTGLVLETRKDEVLVEYPDHDDQSLHACWIKRDEIIAREPTPMPKSGHTLAVRDPGECMDRATQLDEIRKYEPSFWRRLWFAVWPF